MNLLEGVLRECLKTLFIRGCFSKVFCDSSLLEGILKGFFNFIVFEINSKKKNIRFETKINLF